MYCAIRYKFAPAPALTRLTCCFKHAFGFKGIKSIVKITFVEKQPPATWNIQAPREYGFYSNVNPERSHPRWSQARERVITGEGGLKALFAPRAETKMFNGYAEEVASLYAGMGLIKNF